MKRTALISFAFLLAMETLAAAQYPEWLGQVQIVPPNPTSSDAVSITLSGEWHDSCIPNDSAVSLMADDIYFDVVRDYDPWFMCFQFCCPGWERTESVGPLSPGTYTVYACLIPDSDVYELVAEFTVTGQYYVAVNGNDSNDGLTSETAFATIQKGINTAVNGDTVIVLPGSYPQNVDFLGKNIIVRSTDPTDANIVGNTIIDGNDADSVVAFSGTESNSCVLSGFTITNGRAHSGGGIRGNDTTATIQNNIISGNEAIGGDIPGAYGHGGGLLCCHGIIQNNTISFNSAMIGGGLNCCGGTIQHNTIQDNSVGYLGGGLAVCSGTIQYNIISRNSAGGHGGGLAYCSATIRNNIISYNSAPSGVGGGLYECNSEIKNNTICGNYTRNGGGGLSDCVGLIANCILWENSPDQIRNGLLVMYGNIQGGWPGSGNIDVDPCFADPCNGDYHLQSTAGRWDPNSETWVTDTNTSCCIDAGNPGCPPANEPIPNGNRINMGAYGGTAEASKSPASWALLADLTNDHRMDFDDLNVFVSYWLECGENIPSDLDRSQCVDFSDLNIFADQWAESYLPEAGMDYQIGDCNLAATGAASGEPNFSVWVEGRYIHFEDTMYANCCPFELRLEKEINGNQIKIYEIGYDGMCFCMCYFPVTATLGPFPDGTYTVEVFDNLGQSLGVVVVVIAGSDQPGAAYQIGGCSPEASALSATEQADQTRFTVTVDGRHIHFEDMMVANCCPDELELQMTAEGNLIAIHEIEHISMPCRCTCEYPLTATLGPFDPGAYTLEVYQDVYYEGSLDGTYFVGSTTVTID